jgi:GNAT superfamily N-acetyltransferase
MRTVQVTVYYLGMDAHNGCRAAPPRSGLTVLHAQMPTVAYYRYLYNSVGKDYYWYTRGRMPDAELAASLQHPDHEVQVLHVDGTPAGFAELDCRTSEVELLQFGLMPEFIGQGLGKYFLQWTIDHVFTRKAKRFWLHTCTLDHPAALPNYMKAGFTKYKDVVIERELE